MIYNNPNTANMDCSPVSVGRLAQLGNVRYI